MLAASNGVSGENGGWGYECPQHRDLLVAIGPEDGYRLLLLFSTERAICAAAGIAVPYLGR
jgi:hypothetical protein